MCVGAAAGSPGAAGTVSPIGGMGGWPTMEEMMSPAYWEARNSSHAAGSPVAAPPPLDVRVDRKEPATNRLTARPMFDTRVDRVEPGNRLR